MLQAIVRRDESRPSSPIREKICNPFVLLRVAFISDTLSVAKDILQR